MAYPLGWSVVPQILVRRERWSSGSKAISVPLVFPGQEVQPDQPIIRLETLEEATAENHASPQAMPPRFSMSSMSNSGSTGTGSVGQNTLQATGSRSNGMNGEAGASSTSQTLPSGLRGRVVDITRRGGVVIESLAAVVQGAIGAGSQVAGILSIWRTSPSNGQQHIPPGAILVVPGPLNFAMLRQAISSGVVAVVASSVSTRDLEGFLRTDLVKLINSIDVEQAQTALPPMTLLLTEGLGTLAMPTRTLNLLNHYQGSVALISGTTSIQQGIYPELIVSLPVAEAQQNWQNIQPDPTLMIGAQVRVCGGNFEGAIGEVNHLFTHQQLFASGIRSRAARLHMEDGSTLIVPLTLIERIG